MLLGGGGLVFRALGWGMSAERRAATSPRILGLNSANGNGQARPFFPNIPDRTSIMDSPGTRLAYRLPIAASHGWSMLVTLAACLVWNGIVAVFLQHAVAGHLRGQPDWLLSVFLVPFVTVGIGLFVWFARQLLVATGIGPTLVEITDHPLQPGRPCRLLVSQAGRLKMNSLEVALVCEEKATFRHGTDTRTESRDVVRLPLVQRREFTIEPGLPFEADCELVLPAGSMHSFKSEHNEINWKIIVKGEVAGWPDYERSFPVIVFPQVLASPMA
jgi:hypothetical protein